MNSDTHASRYAAVLAGIELGNHNETVLAYEDVEHGNESAQEYAQAPNRNESLL